MLLLLEQIYEKIAHLIGSSTLQTYTDNMNIEFLFLSPDTVNHFGQKCSGQNIGGK